MRTAWWENGSVVVELREEELKNIEEQVELKWEASIKESRKRKIRKMEKQAGAELSQA